MSAVDEPTTTDVATTTTPTPETGRVILTTDKILNAPSDLAEDMVEVPEWGGWLRIRSLTAAEQAKVKQASIDLSGRTMTLIFAEMEKRQFEYGVVEPKFTGQDVNVLFHRSGPSWRRVITALDKISGTTDDERERAAAAFQGSGADGS